MQLTCYLFDESVKRAKDAWKDEEQQPPDGYEPITLRPAFRDWAEAYIYPNKPSIPSWVDFVSPCCEPGELEDIENASNSLILFLKVQKRLFAVCFGYAYTAIDQEKAEPDFGLWVTANSIRPDSIRAIQARNLDPTTISKLYVANRDSDIHEFEVDFFLNILTSLEGCPDSSDLGNRIRGRDACYITKKMKITELKQLCEDLLKAFKRKRKNDPFEMIRGVRAEKRKTIIEALDNSLAQALRQGNNPSLGLALPDIGNYEQIDHYEFGNRSGSIPLTDLSISDVYDWIKQYAAANTKLLDVCFKAYDAQGNQINPFPLNKALIFQTNHEGETYVHTLGRWYHVAGTFVQLVRDELQSKIKIIPKGTWLPDIHETGDKAEGRYNKRVARRQGMALLDCKGIQIQGESQIEAADLFTDKKQFVHVKRHTRSSTLSHLFSQGSVSGRLFKAHAEYRQKTRDKLPKGMQKLIDLALKDVGKYTVVYAITAPATKNLPDDLPFFSRVNLWHHTKILVGLGYNVQLYHIQEV